MNNLEIHHNQNRVFQFTGFIFLLMAITNFNDNSYSRLSFNVLIGIYFIGWKQKLIITQTEILFKNYFFNLNLFNIKKQLNSFDKICTKKIFGKYYTFFKGKKKAYFYNSYLLKDCENKINNVLTHLENNPKLNYKVEYL